MYGPFPLTSLPQEDSPQWVWDRGNTISVTETEEQEPGARSQEPGARSQEPHGVIVPGDQVAPPKHTRRSTSPES